MIVCLGLLGSLAAASGCGDQNPVSSVGEEEATTKGEAQRKARESAYGKGGQPPIAKKGTAKTPPK